MAADLADVAETVAVFEVASAEDGAAAGRRLAGEDVEALLVVQTMAVPAAWTMAVVDALPGVPVVIWALHETGLVDGAFDHGSITTQGATVGAPMIGNLLARADRPFELILGRRSDPATLGRVRSVRSAWPASPGASLGRGWGASGDRSTATRTSMSTTMPCGRRRASGSCRSSRTRSSTPTGPSPTTRPAALESEVRRDWTFEVEPLPDDLDRSLRAALALRSHRRPPRPGRRRVQLPCPAVPVRRADRHRAVLGAWAG